MEDKLKEELALSKENTEKIVSDSKLLEFGVYFGHKKNMWNPKMKQYIHSTKNKIHIIDIQKTQKALSFAFSFIKKIAEKGGDFIFVGTKRQAKDIIKEQALRTNSFYVNERWLGGTLTNKKTIFSRVKTMENLEEMEANNWEGLTKKEGILQKKELSKLQRNFEGIRNMKFVPSIMIIADPNYDLIAIKEAKKVKNIKIIGIVDTNCDPGLVDIPIPSNDDSIKSLMLILTILADAIVSAKNGQVKFAFQPDEAIVLPPEFMEKKIQRDNAKGPRTFNSNRPRREWDGKKDNKTSTGAPFTFKKRETTNTEAGSIPKKIRTEKAGE
ncbi:MAG: 30S ribosomal protein S2 [Metamycoplasmataceae bacterium]